MLKVTLISTSNYFRSLLMTVLMSVCLAGWAKPDESAYQLLAQLQGKLQPSTLDAFSSVKEVDAMIAGRTLLHAAVLENSADAVDLLIENGASASTKNVRGMTALHLAAMQGNGEILDKLLAHSDLFTRAPNGYAAFDFALENGHTPVMLMLIEHMQTQSSNSEALTSLEFIKNIIEDNLDGVVELLAQNNSPNIHNPTNYAPLPLAVRLNLSAMAEKLLEAGADPNIGNNGNDEAIPLNQATRGNNLLLAKRLVKAGADINKENGRGYRALHLALMYGHQQMIDYLLANGADTNAQNHQGITPLMIAAALKHAKAAEQLIELGAELDTVNGNNFSAFDYALQSGAKSIVEQLLAARHMQVALAVIREQTPSNAKYEITDPSQMFFGHSLISLATHYAQFEQVTLMIERTSDLNMRNVSGYQTTLLIDACRSGQLEMLTLLINAGADVNQTDGHGDPAINWAVALGRKEFVQALLSHGANPHIKNKNGYTAIKTAEERGFEEILKLLKTYAPS